MAGDWIKWEKGLLNKPEVAQIARRLRCSKYEAAARLMLVWEWADSVTHDGFVGGMAAEDVDSIAGLDGMAAAMAATFPSPWLHTDGPGVTFPNYHRHNGESARRRALDAERKRQARASANCPHEMRTKTGRVHR